MGGFLQQSTAATIKLGPFVDSTDGATAETSLTISQADIRLTKNGGDFAQSNNNAGATHDENGYYDVPLDTTDTNTLGRLRVAVSESGALPVWDDFMVVPANVYNSLIAGTDTLDVTANAINVSITTVASLIGTPLNGANVVLRRGDTLSWIREELGSLTGYTSLWITVKPVGFETPDAKSLFQIKKNASGTGDGLLYANGAAAGTAADGSITIDDEAAGDITIALQETVTDDFAPGEYRYDIQKLVSGVVTTLTEGMFTVVADVTQAIT